MLAFLQARLFLRRFIPCGTERDSAAFRALATNSPSVRPGAIFLRPPALHLFSREASASAAAWVLSVVSYMISLVRRSVMVSSRRWRRWRLSALAGDVSLDVGGDVDLAPTVIVALTVGQEVSSEWATSIPP